MTIRKENISDPSTSPFTRPDRQSVLRRIEMDKQPESAYIQSLPKLPEMVSRSGGLAFRIFSNAKEHLRTLRNLTRTRRKLQEVFVRAAADRQQLEILVAENKALHDSLHRLTRIVEDQYHTASMLRSDWQDVDTNSTGTSYPAVTHALADRYRGSREARVEWMYAFLQTTGIAEEANTSELDIVDLGCGRGEWLEVLGEQSIRAQGIDNNTEHVNRARQSGLTVTEGDALDWLTRQKDASVDLVSALHLFEFLDYQTVVGLLAESMRVLKPGGCVLIATANPENPTVSSSAAWNIPEIKRLYPPELLVGLLEGLNFQHLRILRRLPHQSAAPLKHSYGKAVPVEHMLNVSPDYAVLCQR